MEGDWKIYLAKVAALVGAYYGAAKLGLNLAFETESVTAVPGWSCPGFDDTWTLPVASRRK